MNLYDLCLHHFTESIIRNYSILLKYKIESSIWKIYSTISSSWGICVGIHTGFSAMSGWKIWKWRNKNLLKSTLWNYISTIWCRSKGSLIETFSQVLALSLYYWPILNCSCFARQPPIYVLFNLKCTVIQLTINM